MSSRASSWRSRTLIKTYVSPRTVLPFKSVFTIVASCALLFAAGCGSTSEISTTSSAERSHPLVAQYGTKAPAGSSVVVEFGPTTAYGRRTSALPAPPGGGDLVVLVAGMKPSTTYHMRARITNSDGSTTLEPDRTFETGAINAANFPVIKTL